VPGRNRPSSGESDDPEPEKDRVALLELVRGEEDGVGAGIAMVSSPLDFGVNTDPHDPQKRLLFNISAEQDGHLVIQRNSQSGTQVSHLRTLDRNSAPPIQPLTVAARLP
jgi:hypothetical protein